MPLDWNFEIWIIVIFVSVCLSLHPLWWAHSLCRFLTPQLMLLFFNLTWNLLGWIFRTWAQPHIIGQEESISNHMSGVEHYPLHHQPLETWKHQQIIVPILLLLLVLLLLLLLLPSSSQSSAQLKLSLSSIFAVRPPSRIRKPESAIRNLP